MDDERDVEAEVQDFLKSRLQHFIWASSGPLHLCLDDGNCSKKELERELLEINACLLYSVLADMMESHAAVADVDHFVRPLSAWTADMLKSMDYFTHSKGLRELVVSKTSLEAALEYYYGMNRGKEGWGDNEPEFTGVDHIVP